MSSPQTKRLCIAKSINTRRK